MNPGAQAPGAPVAPAPWQAGAPQTPPPGAPPQPAPAWGQQGYGAPPPPPTPKAPNPLVENLKQELMGQFPTPTDAPQGKLWAILCYLPGVFIPLWLVPLVRRNNHLSLFHAKQMLGFAALQVPAWVVFAVLSVLVRGIPNKTLSLALNIVLSVGLFGAFLLVAAIGLIGALRGQVKPLPLIGRTIDRMARGLIVVPPVSNPEPQLAYWLRVAPVGRPGTGPAPTAPTAPAMPPPGMTPPSTPG